MNKKKNLKKRILALLGVLVILVGVIMVPVGAWEMTDIPFYNYFNNGLFTVTYNDGRNAYITSSDVESGWMDFEFKYNGNETYYVPTQYVNRTFREFCPELVLGETYILSNEFSWQISGEYTTTGNAEIQSVSYLQLNHPDTGRQIRWHYGDTIVITDEILDSVPMIFAAFIPSGVRPVQGADIYTRMRIWINKGTEAQPFCSYDMARELNQEAYEQGRLDGFNEYVNRSSVFTKKSFMRAYFEFNNGSASYQNPNILYNYTGYTYSTRSYDPSYYISQIDNSKLTGIDAIFALIENDVEYFFGSTPLILNYKGCVVSIGLFTETGGETWANFWANDGPVTVDVNDHFKMHSVGERVAAIYIFVRAYEFETEPEYDPNFYASLSVANTGGVEYQAGFKAGQEIKADEAFAEGVRTGEKNGYNEGFNKAKNYYYKQGTEDGYYKGLAEGQKDFKFVNMITALVDVPVNAFRNLFNFNLLGVDMSSFALSLITVALCITIIKKVV